MFDRLFRKLEEERIALGGRVFDVLGRVTFEDKSLRDLLVEAVRYGDRPDVRARLNQVVDNSLEADALRKLLEEYALTTEVMNPRQVMRIKEDMERMEARKLEPHFIEAFFLEAMRSLGGSVVEREPGRYEVLDVPFCVRSRDMHVGNAEPVLRSYERICFQKERCAKVEGIPADLVCPGHPLLDAVVAVVLDQGRSTMARGSILVDDDPTCDVPRLLFYVESAIKDGTLTASGTRRTVSKAVHFVEIDSDGRAHDAGYAPYLDYRAPTESERGRMGVLAEDLGFLESDPDGLATDYAIQNIIPRHVREVRQRTLARVEKTRKAVEARLKQEIQYWDGRAWELQERENAGKRNAKINSAQAQRRADELAERLARRTHQLELQAQLSPLPPRVIGGALVLPATMLRGPAQDDAQKSKDAQAKRRVELAAMDAVKQIERELGYEPTDRSDERGIGYDIESAVPEDLRQGNDPVLRMIEVKGVAKGSDAVTLSKNEILAGLNNPNGWFLAVVEVEGTSTHTTYLKRPAMHVPSFTENGTNFDIGRLRKSAEVVLERTLTW